MAKNNNSANDKSSKILEGDTKNNSKIELQDNLPDANKPSVLEKVETQNYATASAKDAGDVDIEENSNSLSLSNDSDNKIEPTLGDDDKSLSQKAIKKKRLSPDCKFNDSLVISILTRFGFIPVAVFIGLSILFTILNVEWWKNAINVLFMSFAVLSYAIQKTIEYAYSKKCACDECKSEYSPLLIRMVVAYILFAVGMICFGVFYGKVMA